MSYNLKYHGSFNDIPLKDRIDIYILQKDFVGSSEELLLDGNPLTISYPKQNFYDTLFGCGCKINIINDSSNFFRYNSLFDSQEMYNYVEIIKSPISGDASMFLFQGYVLPEMYNSTLESNIRVTITATDGLSQLDLYAPILLIDTSTYRSDEYINAFSLISSILVNDTDITKKIAVHNDLCTTNYTTDSSSSIFNAVFLSADNFADDKGIQNEEICLDKIFKPFYTRCYYSNGKWMLERMSDIKLSTKDFVIFEKDASPNVYPWVYDNKRIDLSCPNHELIAKSAILTYNPGFKKVILNTKHKMTPSLVENYYYDFQYYINDTSAISTKPLPKVRKWMMSALDASIDAMPYSSSNVKSGLFYFTSIWGTLANRYTWFKEQYASTCFRFTADPLSTIISVKYSYEVSPGTTKNGYYLQGGFALRACSGKTDNWWIAKSNPNDISTYWSNTPYLFDTSILYDQVVIDRFLFTINQEINVTIPMGDDTARSAIVKENYNIGEPIEWSDGTLAYPIWSDYEWQWKRRAKGKGIKDTGAYMAKMYLDIYPLLYTSVANPASWNPYYTWFGDVDVDVDTVLPNEYMEVDLDNYRNIAEHTIETFDVSILQFVNGLYEIDTSDNVYFIEGWRDSLNENYITLQEDYMENLVHMYEAPRYTLNCDIRSKDSSLFTLGNIYTHNSIRYEDGALMEFICNGFDYNVRENTYRLELQEFVTDSSYRINPDLSFTTIPTTMTFDCSGHGVYSQVQVLTNTTYYGDASLNDWITLSWWVHNFFNVDVSINDTGIGRDGSIYLYPTDLSTYIIPVHQDACPDGSPALTLSDDYLYFNEAGTACSVIFVDVSSNSSWTATPGNGIWELSNYSGIAGITRVFVTYTPDSYISSYGWQFKIGGVHQKWFRGYGIETCP